MDAGAATRSTPSAQTPPHVAAGITGLAATIENPTVIRRLVDLVAAVGVATTAGFTVLFFAFDEPVAGWSTVVLTLTLLISWLALVSGQFAGRVVVAVAVAAGVAAANHVAVHVALGGFAYSGGYLFGGLVLTLVAGFALPRTATGIVAVAYCVLAVVLGLSEASLSASRPPPDTTLSTTLFVTVLTSAFVMLVPIFVYSLRQLASERDRVDALLLNILPEAITGRLKSSPGMLADQHDHCSVVFADLVGFTAHAKGKDPAQVVGELNAIFSRFDALVAEHRAEKIKTIGDGYMAACGLPDPDPDHVAHACDLALAMVAAMPALNAELGTGFQLRVGVNTGSAIAGIVGSSKFAYDVWGDMVNLASRLESDGVPGVVVTSSAVVDALHGRYAFEPLGAKDLKGEGPTDRFAVVGPAAGPST